MVRGSEQISVEASNSRVGSGRHVESSAAGLARSIELAKRIARLSSRYFMSLAHVLSRVWTIGTAQAHARSDAFETIKHHVRSLSPADRAAVERWFFETFDTSGNERPARTR
jgi:hypothetical protein